ncbi:MAG: response regulator [Bacteroidales bacterium]|nr:response regulator [Bacteroidales bacterium]
MDNQFTILVVDDEPIGRQLLEAVLFPEGYQILFAENGKEAFDLTVAKRPDLVMLDVMMPDMDGFETCKLIRNTKEVSNTPVFLITALDDRDSRLKGLDSGADDYISKPFDRVEIIAKVKNVKQNRKATQSIIAEPETTTKTAVKTDLKILELLLDPDYQLSALKTDYQLLLHESYEFRGVGMFTISLPESNILAFFGNNLDDDDSVLMNSIVASLLPKVLHKSDTLSVCQALKNKLDKTDDKYKNSGFWISMIQHYTESKQIQVSGINSLAFVRCKNTQFQLQPYYNTGTQNLDFTDFNQVVLVSSKLSNKVPPHEIFDIMGEENASFEQSELKKKLISKLANQSVMEEGDALIVMNY